MNKRVIALLVLTVFTLHVFTAVSYTHLDVYKRQPVSLMQPLFFAAWHSSFLKETAGFPDT